MARTQLNVRVPDTTISQIADLRKFGYESQAHVVMIAVDRMYKEEIKPVSNATVQQMAKTAIEHWLFDEDTDPDGAVMAGLEYLASDGELDQDIIDGNIAHGNDFDGLQDWALRLGQQINE